MIWCVEKKVRDEFECLLKFRETAVRVTPHENRNEKKSKIDILR